MLSGDLRARREAIVREHLASENAHEFDRTIGRLSTLVSHPLTTKLFSGICEIVVRLPLVS
jgi:hypothetical protein